MKKAQKKEMNFLHWLVVQLAFEFLVVAHFTNCLHEIFLHNIFTFSTENGKHSFMKSLRNFS